MSQAAAIVVQDPSPAAPKTPGPIDHRKHMPSFDYMSMMREVAQTGGKTYFAQTREMYELKFGPGRISPVEYYYYSLFDDALTKDEKRAFVGVNLRAEINKHLLDKDFFGVGKDKTAFYAFMAGVGLPIPRTLGLCHPIRTLHGAASLRGGDAFANFLRQATIYPLFCKPAHLTASVGAASLERYLPDSDEIEIAGGLRFQVTRFVEEATRYFKGGYLVQERLGAHASLAPLAGSRLSTIRMMVLADEGDPKIIRATWRVPAGEATADVMWRGNMMAALDPESGSVRRVIRGRGLERKEMETHPDTGARLLGAQMPFWQETCALTLAAAASLPKLTLTGWDVSITEKGPVLIELEPDGGDPAVTQLASGEGLLSGAYGAFVERNRAKLKAKG